MFDRGGLKREALGCLGQDKPAGELVACIARHFPDLDVNRENEDLVIKGRGRYLIVKRLAVDRFRVSQNVAVPSTSQVESGSGDERTLDELIDEIATLAD